LFAARKGKNTVARIDLPTNKWVSISLGPYRLAVFLGMSQKQLEIFLKRGYSKREIKGLLFFCR